MCQLHLLAVTATSFSTLWRKWQNNATSCIAVGLLLATGMAEKMKINPGALSLSNRPMNLKAEQMPKSQFISKLWIVLSNTFSSFSFVTWLGCSLSILKQHWIESESFWIPYHTGDKFIFSDIYHLGREIKVLLDSQLNKLGVFHTCTGSKLELAIWTWTQLSLVSLLHVWHIELLPWTVEAEHFSYVFH